MKKRFILVWVLILTAFIVYGTGQKETSGKKENSLRIKCVSWIAKKAFVSQAIKDFKKDNPDLNVTINLIDEANAQTQSIIWAAGKSDTDLFIGVDPSTAPNFVGQNYIYTMEDLKFWDKYSKDKFVAGPLKECTFGSGTRYLPLMAEIEWYNINTEMFKAAGIMKDDTVPVPESWYQINDWSRILKAKYGRPMNSLTLAPGAFIVDDYDGAVQALMGSRRFEADGTTLVTDSPEIRQILTTRKKAWDEGLLLKNALTDGSAGRDAYAAGKIAMTSESNSRWVAKEKDIGIGKTAPMAFPGGLKNGSLMWISAIAIPRSGSAPNLAQKFAIYLLQDKYQKDMMTTYGKMAAVKSAYQGVDKKFTQMEKALEKSTPNPMYKDFDVYYDKLGDLLQNYILGKMDLNTFLAKHAELLKSIDKTIVQ